MITIKMNALGTNKLVKDKPSDLTITVDINDDELEDMIGKIMYTVECAGFDINTHNIYPEAIKSINEAKLNDKFKKAYTLMNDNLVFAISLKKQ